MIETGKMREAAVEFRKARELEPNNIYFSKQEGFCYYHLGEYPDAIRFLVPAFRKDPNDYRVKSTLKKMYLSTGNIEGFITLLEDVLKEHPQNVKLIGTLSSLKKKTGAKDVDSD